MYNVVTNIFDFITLFSYLVILVCPFYIYLKYNKIQLFSLFFIAIIFTFFLFSLSTIWSEELTTTIKYYLFNFYEEGNSDEERLKNVALINKQAIQNLYNRSMGVGWPLKLILKYIIFILPFNIIVCVIMYCYRRVTKTYVIK